MNHCFRCELDLPDDVIFCLNCGTKLDDGAATVVRDMPPTAFAINTPPMPTPTPTAAVDTRPEPQWQTAAEPVRVAWSPFKVVMIAATAVLAMTAIGATFFLIGRQSSGGGSEVSLANKPSNSGTSADGQSSSTSFNGTSPFGDGGSGGNSVPANNPTANTNSNRPPTNPATNTAPVVVSTPPAEEPTPKPVATPKSAPKTISGGVLNGKATSLPTPPYPAAAKAIRASGSVSVQVLIDESGRVISAGAVSGHPLLRPAAESAARGARFTPTVLGGQPVKVSGVITYNFSM